VPRPVLLGITLDSTTTGLQTEVKGLWEEPVVSVGERHIHLAGGSSVGSYLRTAITADLFRPGLCQFCFVLFCRFQAIGCG
jgi:hypothetical protein